MGILDLAGIPSAPASAFPEQALEETRRLLDLEEERGTAGRDPWSCPLPEGTSAGREGRLEQPPVDRWVRLLLERLAETARTDPGRPLVRIRPWPEGRPFAVHLSHDLDLVRKGDLCMGLRHLAGFFLDAGNARLGLGKIATWGRTRGTLDSDPYWQPRRWAEAEERRGLRSDWFALVSTGDNAVPYRLEDIAGDLRQLASHGHGVGLHGSAPSYRAPARLRREKALLEEAIRAPVSAVRQHNLSLEGLETWRRQAEAGFAVDASLGFNRALGWRSGTSYPIPCPSDPRLLLLPLTAMDGVLMASGQGEVGCRGLLEAARREGGIVSFDWHGQTADAEDYPGYAGLYETLLDEVAASGAWTATADQIAAWWRARSRALEAWRHGESPELPGGVLEAFHAPGACPFAPGTACRGSRCEQPVSRLPVLSGAPR